MVYCHRIFFIFSVLIHRWLIITAEENYFLGTPRFTQTYQPTQQEFNTPFRKKPQDFRSGSFIPNSDLETSDLPTHLQRRLPQYQFSSFENPDESSKFQFQSQSSRSPNSPAPFAQHISPSTHRPSYSHLFSRTSHNHDPSQTETFLGEITIQSPAELPIEFKNRNIGGFQPSVHFPVQQVAKPNNTNIQNSNGVIDQHLDSTPTNHYTGNARANFLNHRTRIVAPETGHRPEVNDYFVNSNGDVFVTTKRPEYFGEYVSTQPTNQHNEASSASTQDTRTIENTFNLDSLLEEPVDKSEPSSNKDNVEVIKAVTLSPDNFYLPGINATKVALSVNDDYTSTDDSEDYDYDTTAVYDDETTTTISTDSEEATESTELNTVDSNKKGNAIVQESGYEVLTMKPATMVKDDNFKKFVDSSVIDNPTNPPIPRVKDLEDTIISVVTTKSIVNNTVIAALPSNQSVTEQISATSPSIDTNENSTTDSHLQVQLSSPRQVPGEEEVSTEGWVVVASVQTSRSVSGARYLPFPVVEQHERTKLLNEREKEEEETAAPETTTTETESTTITSGDKQNTSTESLTDKLDRVQSDLSLSFLTGSFNNEASNIAVITEGQLDKSDETTMFDGPSGGNVTTRPSSQSQGAPPVVIRKFSPLARPTTTARNRIGFKPRSQSRKVNSPVDIDKPQSDQPVKLYIPDIKLKNGTTGRSSGISNQNQIIVQDVNQPKEAELSQKSLEHLLHKIKFKETSALLPPDYYEKISSNKSEHTKKTKPADVASLLPPGYNLPSKQSSTTTSSIIFDNIKQVDVSALLPPGYNIKSVQNDTLPKPNQNSSKIAQNKTDPFANLFKKAKQDNISAFLPPGYKSPIEEEPKPKNSSIDNILKKSVVDISAFLPPGFKPPKSTTTKTPLSIFENAKLDDVSAFLPPGFKLPIENSSKDNTSVQQNTTSTKSKSISDLFENANQDDISAYLPPGFKSSRFGQSKPPSTTTELSTATTTTTTEKMKETTTSASGFKLVFPSRPGGVHRKNSKPSASRPGSDDQGPPPANTPPAIHKGWPTRATTEFTGWPTPSTTPLSIEQLLARARAAAGVTPSTTSETTMSSTTSTTTTSTTTARPTTPGLCQSECDLVGTIKLIGGAKWVPELLDRNTKEWQILANEVQYQLEDIYSKSDVLSKWYKKIRIDGFTKGSVLVDYVVELNNVSREISTTDLKTLFNDALQNALSKSGTNREPKASDLRSSISESEKLSLGNFMVDPTYTDFVVLPKQILPTVGYAEDNVLLPQWAIAIIVIGLASLLFVIIFGVTVIVNKQKNAKKKQPSTLTEEMLNELNKNHMGGIDNYGADDLYNMEDVWNDKPYETKLPKKRSAGSLHDNSMPNIYDSWRSEWNGYYYNTYYGNHPGSSHSGYGRRRSDYDTNF